MSEYRLHIPERVRKTVAQPDWYNRLNGLRGRMMLGALFVPNGREVTSDIELAGVRDRSAQLMIRVFTEMLNEGVVMLGASGPAWDDERQPIDTIIVHHTASAEPMELNRLNAIQLLRLYVPKYQNPGSDVNEIGGLPIYSGHFDEQGKQVFYGYHWLVRRDGERERLLPDEAVGWQAGDWSVNCRSVAVCFDGDFEQGRPTDDALHSAVELVADNYGGHVASVRILGHNAIVETICPGGEFDTHWGAELRALVDARLA